MDNLFEEHYLILRGDLNLIEKMISNFYYVLRSL